METLGKQVGQVPMQTKDRLEGMADLRNAMTAAVMGRAVLFDDPENMTGPMPNTSVSNCDATTLVLHTDGVKSETTYFFKGEKKKARQKGKQMQRAGKTKGKKVYLRLKLYVTTLASGYMFDPIFSITAPGVDKIRRFKVPRRLIHTHTHTHTHTHMHGTHTHVRTHAHIHTIS
jgi:hypothetical protein